MKHKIMVDLDAGKRFGFWVQVTLTSLFGFACLHFLLKFFCGHPCNADQTVCDYAEYELKSTFAELLHNPAVLNEPRNHGAQHLLNMVVLKFVGPAIITITTLAGLLNIESELMPLSKIFEKEPCKVYRDLGNFVFVPEKTLRSVMNDGLEIGADGSECVVADACE